MVNVALLVGPLIAGVLLGYVLRERKAVNLNKTTFGIVLVLIFALGFTIGSNNELLNSLPKVGLTSLTISLLAILFSVLFLILIRKKAGIE